MLLLALAIAPGIAISLFIYSLNKYGRTSLRRLVISFILGMAATLPPFLLQSLAGDVRDDPNGHSILSFAWYAFVVVALSEEGSKWLLLRWYAYPQSFFKEPFDGIIYGVMIGMGFATVENIEYVHKFGWETGLSRAFLSVPAHASFAVLMGYNMGWAKFEPRRATWLMGKGLLIVVLLHGSFDFFLFLKQNMAVKQYLSDGILSFGAFASFYIAVRQAWKAIRIHSSLQEETSPAEDGSEEDQDPSIRFAGLDDINTIGFLAQQIWPAAYGEILSPQQLDYMLNLIYSPASLQRQMKEDKHQFLILEEEGEAVGFAAWSPAKAEVHGTVNATGKGEIYKLHKLYVLPGKQGGGRGRAILRFIFTDIRAKGAKALRLNVNRHNKARHFYERMGFAVLYEEDIPIGNDYWMNDYVMESPV